jgi:four helix bundle protein
MDNKKADNNNKRDKRKEAGGSKIESFTDLKAWQGGHDLVIEIYQATEGFPKREVYALTDQIHRSAVSVTSNIAEGFGRHSYSNRLRFYRMARGSLTELQNQLLIAKDVGYLEKNKFDELADQSTKVHKLLQGLISATKKRQK